MEDISDEEEDDGEEADDAPEEEVTGPPWKCAVCPKVRAQGATAFRVPFLRHADAARAAGAAAVRGHHDTTQPLQSAPRLLLRTQLTACADGTARHCSDTSKRSSGSPGCQTPCIRPKPRFRRAISTLMSRCVLCACRVHFTPAPALTLARAHTGVHAWPQDGETHAERMVRVRDEHQRQSAAVARAAAAATNGSKGRQRQRNRKRKAGEDKPAAAGAAGEAKAAERPAKRRSAADLKRQQKRKEKAAAAV